MKNIILNMSMCGTAALLLYKIFYPFSRKYFLPKWRYICLKIVLAFYLIPVPWFINELKTSLKNHIPDSSDENIFVHIPYCEEAKMLIVSRDTFFLPPYLVALAGVLIFLSIISLLLIVLSIYRYAKEKQKCLKRGHEVSSKLFQNELSAHRLNHEIKLVVSQKAKTPFVIGIRKPVVVISDAMLNDIDSEETLLCIRHELLHIKNRDLIYRFLVLLAVCFHWFNPICRLLMKEITVVSEICCDNQILRTLSASQKKVYYNLLISLAESNRLGFKNNVPAYFSNENANEIRRRIQEVEFMKKPKMKAAAVLSCCMVFAAGAVSAMAYEPVQISNVSATGQTASEFFQGEIEFYSDAYHIDSFEKLPFDCFFTDEQGNIYDASSQNQERRACEHDYESGTVTKHIVNSNGGGRVEYYNARRCKKCGYTLIYDCYQRITFEKCPH